jgi:putative membrane-bound dehydrogenase-like protein
MRKSTLAVLTLSWFAAAGAFGGPYDPAPTPAIPPEEAHKSFRVPEGFEVRLFAAEPDVVNPVAMTWDDRGRLWVVELFDYPYTAKEGAKSMDRVKVLEDTDNDGRADKVTVFAAGLNLATAVQIGNGGVYVGAAPNLWFMKDTNGDDVADEKTVLLTGFGLEDRHELLNNFTWGPDGWMYFTHGVFTSSKVKDPEHPERPEVKFNAGVVRFNPADKRIELWADGISNQWGIDWDRYGNAFVSACVVEHLWHVVPGGVYVRQGGVPGNQYAYDLLRHINDHKHYRAAYAGAQVYQGGAYPPEYDGTILMGNIHGNCINRDKLVPNGSSLTAQDLHNGKDHVDDAFLNSTDGWFRPVSTKIGPDGNLWIMDWYDKYPCYQNARQPDLDRAKGRIWRVVYTGNEKGRAVPSRPATDMDLRKLSTNELVRTLSDRNVWMRRHAQRILGETREGAGDLHALALDAGRPLETRLAAFWTLFRMGVRDDALRSLAQDKEAAIRMWVARYIGEQSKSSDEQLGALAMLAQDPSPVVRAAVAQSAKRLVNLDSTRIVLTLLEQKGTAQDSMLPQLIWYALEPLAAKNPKPFLDFFASNENALAASGPLVPRSLARRLYASGDAKLTEPLFAFLKANKDKPLAGVLIDGVLAGHKNFMDPPENYEAFAADLARSGDKTVVAKAKQLATVWGARASVAAALKIVTDTNAPEADRAASVKLLRGNKSDEVRKAVLAIFNEWGRDPIKLEVLGLLPDVGQDADAAVILKTWSVPNAVEVKRAAAETLASRPAWAKALLKAVKEKHVDSADVPLPAVRNIATLAGRDNELKSLMASTIGVYRETPGDKQKIIEAKKKVVMEGPVDKERGHKLFLQHCAVCHVMNGEGASPNVGPDITGVGRGTLDLLLNNVIDPDQIIGAGYENTIVETNDGDVKSGRLVEETDQYIKLLSAGPREDVLRKKDIKERRVSNKSVMPEGFEQTIKDDEFRDLMRYVLEAPAKQ